MNSMTGYARYDFDNDNFKVKIEIKTLNSKALNIKIRAPYFLNYLEVNIRKVVSKYVNRGSIDLRIDFENKCIVDDFLLYDKNFALNYIGILDQLESDLNIKIDNKISYLISQNSLIKKDEVKFDEEEYRQVVIESLKMTLSDLDKMKKLEGKNIKEYINKCLDTVSDKIDYIKENKSSIPVIHKDKMLKRLNDIEDKIDFNEEEILKEILIYTDKSDISEEVSRLDSHMKYFREVIDSGKKGIGKKLDFILQEMFRELNTASVKSHCYNMSRKIVEAKSEIEKIREQVQNIE